MEDQNRKWKTRWRLLIYPKFQLTLLGINGLVLTLCFLVTGLLSHRSYQEVRAIGMTSQLPPEHPFFRFLQIQFNNTCLYLAFAFCFSLLTTSLVTLLLSHRLAGPIVRLLSFFKKIGDHGYNPNHDRLGFRKNDFFEELPSAINKALERIKK